MGVDEFNQEELTKIYRRGRATVNSIRGKPEGWHLIDEYGGKPHDVENYIHERTDDELFRELVIIPFFAGMKAKVVEGYRSRIMEWLGDYRKVSHYSEKEFKEMKADKSMFKHMGKIQAAIDNSREFQKVIGCHGSFIKYIFSFEPYENWANLERLIDDFRGRFIYYSFITTLHYLMSIGIQLPLLKPDLHITRTFWRIGLVGNEKARNERDAREVLRVGVVMAEAACVPVDWVDGIVDFGLKDFWYPGSEVCGEVPDCNREKNRCEIRELCNYWRENCPE